MITDTERDVINVYEKIATHFSVTRFSHWKCVKDFVLSLTADSLLADIGCGNGKNMKIRDDLRYIGMDASAEFCKIVKDRGFDCIQGNILAIPIKDNFVDNTICVAVIHHLSTEENRKQAIDELIRITKPGGKIFIQVWANIDGGEGDRYIKWNHNKKYGSEEIYQRYYHFFNERELENYIIPDSRGENVEILESFYNHENYGVILKKI